ncbi:hypothetical protein FB479_103820 [Brevibacillus sp. AG162]|nr:hypothetical protein FB479_103820 [Brevibacillus sp. AG162]
MLGVWIEESPGIVVEFVTRLPLSSIGLTTCIGVEIRP